MTKKDVNFATNDTGMLQSTTWVAKNTLDFLAFWQILFGLCLCIMTLQILLKKHAYLWIEVLTILLFYITVTCTVLHITYIW